jgi:hypothetical protein
LPYVLRFRQCLHEFYQSNYSSPRPLANSLKYLSAFPVILLSAAQKIVVHEIAQQKGITIEELGQTHDRWFGEHPLFRLWLLAVVVNSMFSFYWDVAMDWGLALCEVDTWLPKRDSSPVAGGTLLSSNSRMGSPRRSSHTDLSIWARTRRLFNTRNSVSHQRSPHPSPGLFPSRSPVHQSPNVDPSSKFFSFGLRQTLLLPDPIVYHIFTIIDFILRLTWSLKLSSHLHTIAEIETGVFLMEGLELLRRWMWIFVRIEWEGVKLGEVARFQNAATSSKGKVGLGLKAGDNQVLWNGDELSKA